MAVDALVASGMAKSGIPLNRGALAALQDGAEVWALIRVTDDDGTKAISFAGRTTVEIREMEDMAGDIEFIPTRHAHTPFYLSEYSALHEGFSAEEWRAEFYAARSGCLQAFEHAQATGWRVDAMTGPPVTFND